MVAKFLPVLNLVNQFFRQISKPLSTKIVKYAKTHPVFRRYFLVLPGRWFYTLDYRIRMQLLETEEKGKRRKELRIDDKTAIDAGANLLSECIIFLIAGLGVMAEVSRNMRNSAAKEAVKNGQMQKLVDEKRDIESTVEKQAGMIGKLDKMLEEYVRVTEIETPTDNPEN